MDNQKILLEIVKTWNLSEKPEYRSFRCANCQKYINKAWYHWLTSGNYITPVHFCDKCEKDFLYSKIIINKPEINIDRNKFGLKFSEEINKKIRKIVKNWNTNQHEYKAFTCDDCEKEMIKAYHVWFNMDKTLVEVHFCKECGDKLKIDKYG